MAFLYERGRDTTFTMIQRDAAALNAEAYSLEALVDARVRSGPVWRRHPRLGSAIAIWCQVAKLMVARRLRALAGRCVPPRLKRLVSADATADVLKIEAHRDNLSAQLAAARSILSAAAPGVMVACEDGISSALPVHAAARQAGIPVVLVPYGYGVQRDLEISLDAKAARGELITLGGRWSALIRRHASQWIKRGAHEGALMYPEEYLLAAESLGITLRDAWIIHGGYADRICVESAQMQRVYRSEGVPEHKLVVTGSPYCDIMVRALEKDPAARAALRQPRRIGSGETLVLVSWPPSYHGERAAFSEFPTYREMSLAALGWLNRQPNCRVTVSLHPATLAEDRAALADIGIRLTDEYVIELIPQHDLFVTYFSSTIRWAVAAGKPVVNFDLYKLGLPVYDGAPGVALVSTLADFQRAITGLLEADAAFATAAEQQIAAAEEWGTLDGESTSRITQVILAA